LAKQEAAGRPGSAAARSSGAQSGSGGHSEKTKANGQPGQAEYNALLRTCEKLESELNTLRQRQIDNLAVARQRQIEMDAEIQRLRQRHIDDLAVARQRQLEMDAEIQRLRSSSNGQTDPLFSKVYLTPTAPRWLILDVQRAFRIRYHPDKHEGSDKRSQAEKVFQNAEQIFRKILELKK